MNENVFDFWRVNSYGYPNPFSDNDNGLQAWETFLTFFDYSSYSALKDFWGSTKAPRHLNSHAVESWKATFEEYGLLYVISRSDEVKITPAGYQLREAAEAKRKLEFGWIGLSLLLRYPLKGSRRSKGPLHETSDLLLYWFLYAAMRELQDYFWWTELERILCKVFNVNETNDAISKIIALRSREITLDQVPRLMENNRGAFYNSLNQIVVHGGMNYLIFNSNTEESFYNSTSTERKVSFISEWIPLVDLALGGTAIEKNCDDYSRFISRIPKAPILNSEQEYFEYIGAKVDQIPNENSVEPIKYASLLGDDVAILQLNIHYKSESPFVIRGKITPLCSLSRGQRIILNEDLNWSYIIEDKKRDGANDIIIHLRRGRPITDSRMIISLLEGNNG